MLSFFSWAAAHFLLAKWSRMRNYPTSFQVRTLWNAATGVSILILGLLLVGLIWLTGKLFGFLQPVLIPVIIAGIVAYLLDPLVRRLERWKLSRLKSVIVVYAALLLGGLLLLLAVLPGVNQARAMLTHKINATAVQPEESEENDSLIRTIASFLRQQQHKQHGNAIGWALTEVDDSGKVIEPIPKRKMPTTMEFFWDTRAGRLLYDYKGRIWEWTTLGTSKMIGLLGFVLGLVMVPIYLFFFLKDSASIQRHWHDYVPLRASHFKSGLIDTLQEINGYLISFFRGQVLVAFIDGILVGIALTFYGLPYGFLIGVFMALLGVIPYIGNILCLIPACIIGWFHAKGGAIWQLDPMSYTIGVVIIFVVVQQINSLVTAPKIVGDSVGLHPMTVIFSMVFWTVILGGFVGALLAVPLTAAIKVLFRRFIWEKKIKEAEAAQEELVCANQESPT
jgi:predicted PurR-regulated permease PerM